MKRWTNTNETSPLTKLVHNLDLLLVVCTLLLSLTCNFLFHYNLIKVSMVGLQSIIIWTRTVSHTLHHWQQSNQMTGNFFISSRKISLPNESYFLNKLITLIRYWVISSWIKSSLIKDMRRWSWAFELQRWDFLIDLYGFTAMVS